MNQTTLTSNNIHLPSRSRFLSNLARSLVFRLLERLEEGELTLVDDHGRATFGRPAQDGLRALVRIRDASVYVELAFGGSNALFESYVDGRWTCDDLVALVRMFVRSPKAMMGTDGGLARVAVWLQNAYFSLFRNTRNRSRRNIAAHYDLGDDFFAQILDDTMTYSCGIFTRPDASLREASLAKIDLICRKLQLSSSDHLLEIGSGWGAMALHAAGEYGCRVTTTTISRRQYEYVRRLIQQASLSDRITLLNRDYRDLEGTYDKLVSVEMIEAVGHNFVPTFFSKCCNLLRPGGLMLLQSITIVDHAYERARGTVDFIKRYIFPGSCIPSVSVLRDCVDRQTDMRVRDAEEIGPHYATTLAAWRRNLLSNHQTIRGLGYSEQLLRAWDLYFAYCEGGFAERYIGDVQMVLAKPNRKNGTGG